MLCSETCYSADGLFQYVFEDSLSTHQDARSTCKYRGWTLATNLTMDDYQKLDNCCNPANTYRIGLVKHLTKCNQSSDLHFSWITSQTCNDGSPLNITGVIPQLCQSVAIPVGGLKDAGYNVHLSNCSSRLPYICQKRIHITPKTSIVTTAPATSLSAGVIAGIIAGGLVALFSFLLLFCCLKKCNRASPKLNTNCVVTNSNEKNGHSR